MKLSLIALAALSATAIAAPSGNRNDYENGKDLSKGKEDYWSKDYYDSGKLHLHLTKNEEVGKTRDDAPATTEPSN